MKIQTYRKLNLFLALFIFFLLTNACSKYCAIHYPCTVKDSVKTTIIERIDTIVVFSESDTMKLKEYVYRDTVIYKENSKQIVKLVYKDRILNGEFICKDDSLKAVIAYRDTLIERYKTIRPDTVKVTPIWVWFALSFAGTVILLLIIRIIFKR